jgi:hypothetical protein
MLPAFGRGLTVTTAVAADVHPLPLVTVYDIVDVPAATPLTEPPVATVAAEVFVLLHTPLPAASLSEVVEPAQTDCVPVMAPALGKELTVATVVVIQPVDATLYVIVEVPAATPPNVPPLTVAMPVLLLTQVSPPVPLNVVAEPAHTVAAPPIADGVAFTVVVVDAALEPEHPLAFA